MLSSIVMLSLMNPETLMGNNGFEVGFGLE
jgi:hypothetical protein